MSNVSRTLVFVTLLGARPALCVESEVALVTLAGSDTYRTLLLLRTGPDLHLEKVVPGVVVPLGERLCPLLIRPVVTQSTSSGIQRQIVYTAVAIHCTAGELEPPTVPREEECSGSSTVSLTFVGMHHLSVTAASDSECSGRTDSSIGAFVVPLDLLLNRWQFDWFNQDLHVLAGRVFTRASLRRFRTAELEQCRSLDPEARELLTVPDCSELPGAVTNDDEYSPWWYIMRGAGRWEVWDAVYGWGGERWPYRVPAAVPAGVADEAPLPVSWDSVAHSVPGALDAFASPDGQILAVITPEALESVRVSSGVLGTRSRLLARASAESIVMIAWAVGPRAESWQAEFSRLPAR